MRTTTHRTLNTRYDIMESSTLFVCGGGASCPRLENLTHTLISPRGALGPCRCPECAVRLGWATADAFANPQPTP